MSKRFPKNVSIALTAEEFEFLEQAADDDRRTTAQFVSIMVSDEISKMQIPLTHKDSSDE